MTSTTFSSKLYNHTWKLLKITSKANQKPLKTQYESQNKLQPLKSNCEILMTLSVPTRVDSLTTEIDLLQKCFHIGEGWDELSSIPKTQMFD